MAGMVGWPGGGQLAGSQSGQQQGTEASKQRLFS